MPQLLILFLIAFLVGADEFLLGPILTPIGHDLGVAPERVTLFITFYNIPLALLAPALGMLSDRWGHDRVLLPAIGFFALASVATGLAQSFETALLARLLTGVAAAGMLPVAFALAADLDTERSGRGIAFVQAGLTLGIIMSPGIGAVFAELLSWRAAFLGLGIAACLVAGSASFSFGRSRPLRSGTLPPSSPLVPGAAGALAAMALALGTPIGIFALVGERLRALFDLQTGLVGSVYVAFGLATVLGNLAMPWVAARIRNARRLIVTAFGLVLLAMATVFALKPGPIVAAAALVVWAVFGGLAAPVLQNFIANLSSAHRGVLMALGASALNIGVAASSAIAGYAFSLGSVWVAAFGILFMLVGILTLQSVRAGKQEPVADRI
jgi:predicted MFS family arabinose efflux permease